MPYYIAELGAADKKYYIIDASMASNVEGLASRVNRPRVFFFHPTPMRDATLAYDFILSIRNVYPHRVIIRDMVYSTSKDLAKIKMDVRTYIASITADD